MKCRQSRELYHLKRLAGRAGLRARGTLGHISHHLLGSNQAARQSDRCSALDTDTNTLQTSPHSALPPRANTPCRGQNAIYLPTILTFKQFQWRQYTIVSKNVFILSDAVSIMVSVCWLAVSWPGEIEMWSKNWISLLWHRYDTVMAGGIVAVVRLWDPIQNINISHTYRCHPYYHSLAARRCQPVNKYYSGLDTFHTLLRCVFARLSNMIEA